VAPKGKDAPKKAVLISGPPGIGKTSAAKIVCRTLGFDVLEVNASDSRGKVRAWHAILSPRFGACARADGSTMRRMRQADSDVKAGLNGKCANVVKEMVTNCAVSFDGSVKKQALIMDEVDGMSGGDRGGVQDLISSIKARIALVRAAFAQAAAADGRLASSAGVENPYHLHL
jgi:replication factor C subunit 1